MDFKSAKKVEGKDFFPSSLFSSRLTQTCNLYNFYQTVENLLQSCANQDIKAFLNISVFIILQLNSCTTSGNNMLQKPTQGQDMQPLKNGTSESQRILGNVFFFFFCDRLWRVRGFKAFSFHNY